MNDHSYHSDRELAEESRASGAASLVARIAHGKLAALHAEAADRAVAAMVRAFQDAA